MARHGRPSSAINANMTPMIDVTFLLIVFFVVVSQIVDKEAVPMDLPLPDQSVSGIPEEPDYVTVNLVPESNGEVSSVVVGGRTISLEAVDELTSIVKSRLSSGAVDVHLRADQSTEYKYIHKAIEAIRDVDTTPRLHLIVSGEDR
ncbi:MAG: biopolymer transporter ExbD [Phycisphaerales bacterium]|jgi:biopolymer transport protein ExbD|nr:biopolymer transporter ExbD [Phycisphaerales bacterium]